MTISLFDDELRVAVDDVLQGMGLNLYLGAVSDTDDSTQTISAPLPYLLRGLVAPFDTNPRVGGRGSSVRQFTLQYVHYDDGGCLNVVNGVRAYLDGQPVSADGREYRIRLSDPTSPATVLRDPTWTRPGGGALFYASDRWNVL